MERHYATYLLAFLLTLLFVSVAGYFALSSRASGRKRQAQRDNQVERERRAEQRMADNGGRALSAPDGAASKAPYPNGHRRPGESGGSGGWK